MRAAAPALASRADEEAPPAIAEHRASAYGVETLALPAPIAYDSVPDTIWSRFG